MSVYQFSALFTKHDIQCHVNLFLYGWEQAAQKPKSRNIPLPTDVNSQPPKKKITTLYHMSTKGHHYAKLKIGRGKKYLAFSWSFLA